MGKTGGGELGCGLQESEACREAVVTARMQKCQL